MGSQHNYCFNMKVLPEQLALPVNFWSWDLGEHQILLTYFLEEKTEAPRREMIWSRSRICGQRGIRNGTQVVAAAEMFDALSFLFISPHPFLLFLSF